MAMGWHRAGMSPAQLVRTAAAQLDSSFTLVMKGVTPQDLPEEHFHPHGCPSLLLTDWNAWGWLLQLNKVRPWQLHSVNSYLTIQGHGSQEKIS